MLLAFLLYIEQVNSLDIITLVQKIDNLHTVLPLGVHFRKCTCSGCSLPDCVTVVFVDFVKTWLSLGSWKNKAAM